MKNKIYIMKKMGGHEISDVIEELESFPKIIQESILKQYTLDDITTPKENLTNKEYDQVRYAIKKIKTTLDNKKEGVIIEKKYQYKPFFSIFPNSKKEDILLIIETLTEYERNLLKKKYGDDLTSTKYNENLSDEEIEIIKINIITKIKRGLKRLETGNFIVISIEELFDNKYSLNTIKESINKLQDNYKEKVYFIFGDNLTKKTLAEKSQYKRVLSNPVMKKLIKELNNEKRFRHSEFKTFISQLESERLEDEKDEELLERAKQEFYHLTTEEKDLLYLKYKEDLLNTKNNGEFSKEDNYQLLNKIIPKIKYYMHKRLEDKPQCEPLMSWFDDLTTFESVLEEIITLPEEEIKSLKIKYTDTFLGTTYIYAFSKEFNLKTKRIIEKIQKRIIKKRSRKTGLSLEILKKAKHLTRTEEYVALHKVLGTNKALAILMKKYLSDSCTLESICALTEVGPLEIVALTKEYLIFEEETIRISSNGETLKLLK